jgi:hypothetical protein
VSSFTISKFSIIIIFSHHANFSIALLNNLRNRCIQKRFVSLFAV